MRKLFSLVKFVWFALRPKRVRLTRAADLTPADELSASDVEILRKAFREAVLKRAIECKLASSMEDLTFREIQPNTDKNSLE